MISVPAGTGDICFVYDIRFAGDIRLQRIIRNGYHIMLPQSGNISYGFGCISYRASDISFTTAGLARGPHFPCWKAASFLLCPSMQKAAVRLPFAYFLLEI